MLADRHIVTRLTENNGNFSFAAQVRLDFGATNGDGSAVWDARGLAADSKARLALIDTLGGESVTDDQRAGLLADVSTATSKLVNSLIPPEGNFMVILVDALDGRDEINVGPTVQKTVWMDAGAGDDVVRVEAGNAILADRTEQNATPGGVRGRNDLVKQAFALALTAEAGTDATFAGLTIDNPDDVDFYRFKLTAAPDANDRITVAGASPFDQLTLTLLKLNSNGNPETLGSGVNSVTLQRAGVAAGDSLLLKVQSNRMPTIYDVQFDFDADAATTGTVTNLAQSSTAIRRDVIVGGLGDDVLIGGGGEDFIFGNDGNDVLSGGRDRGASDLIFGGAGDDTFQIIPDELPRLGNRPGSLFSPGVGSFIPTYSDQFNGDAGNDRVLFLGGDRDRRGFEVPDYAAIRYNTTLHRYEFTSLIWDIGRQKFMTRAELLTLRGRAGDITPADNANFAQEFLFYQSRNIELTQAILNAGNDVFHADPGFKMPRPDGSPQSEEWGIELGDFQQGARESALVIQGDAGNDQLFGGARNDQISGNEGNDSITGGPGNDTIRGGGGRDSILGNSRNNAAAEFAALAPASIIGGAGVLRFASELFRYVPSAPFLLLPAVKRPGIPASVKSGTGAVQLIDDFSTNSCANYVGACSIFSRAGALNPSAGFQQTATVMLNDGSHFVRAGTSFSILVDGREVTSGKHNAHVLVSTAASAANGTAVFGARLRRDATGFRVETFSGGTSSLSSSIADPGGDIVEWVERVDATTFKFSLGDANGPTTLVATATVTEAASFPDMFLGVQTEGVQSDPRDGIVFPFYDDLRFGSQPSDVSNAFALSGGTSGEALVSIRSVGDLNGDGIDDLAAAGRTRAYLFFRPIPIDDLTPITDFADVVIDLTAIGTPENPARLAQRSGDMGADGRDDIGFLHLDGTDAVVTVISLNGGPLAVPHVWDAAFFKTPVGATSRDIRVHTSLIGAFDNLDATFLNWFNDSGRQGGQNLFSEMLVSTRRTAANSNIDRTFNIGFIFSGQTFTSSPGNIDVYDRSGTIVRTPDRFFNDSVTIEVVDGYATGGRDFLVVDNHRITRFDDARPARVIGSADLRIIPKAVVELSVEHRSISGAGNITRFLSNITMEQGDTPASYVNKINAKLSSEFFQSARVYVHARLVGNRVQFETFEQTNDMRLGIEDDVINHPLGFSNEIDSRPQPPLVPVDVAQLVADPLPGATILLNVAARKPIFTMTSSNFAGLKAELQNILNNTQWVGSDTVGNHVSTTQFDDNSGRLVLGVVNSSNGFERLRAGPDFVLDNLILGGRADAGGTTTPLVFDPVITGDGALGTGFGPDIFVVPVSHPAPGATVRYHAEPIPSDDGALDHPTLLADLDADSIRELAMVRGSRAAIFFVERDRPEQFRFDDARLKLELPGLQSAPNQFASGDYDADGHGDFAVRFTPPGATDARVAIFLNPARGLGAGTKTLTLADASAVLVGESTGDGFGPLSGDIDLDINGDHIADLVIGAPAQSSPVGGTPLPGAGRAYVLLGSRGRTPIPISGVIELSNVSFPGSGAFVADPGTGQPEAFDDNGDPYFVDSFTRKFFRFSTLGDGNSGDVVRVIGDQSATATLLDSAGGVIAANRRTLSLTGLAAETYYLNVTTPNSARFSIQISAPIPGQRIATSNLPDADVLFGDDGDDLVTGNDDFDRVFGNSGADTFSAELFEVRDRDVADKADVPVIAGQRISDGRLPDANPIADIDSTLVFAAAAASDLHLIASLNLGFISDSYFIRQRDVESITSLDLSRFVGINPRVLGAFPNLQTLIMPSDSTQLSDLLAALAPSPGGRAALPFLTSLDIGGATFAPREILDLVRAAPGLTSLVVDFRGSVIEAENVNLVVQPGATFNQTFLANSAWVVDGPDGRKFAEGTRQISFSPTAPGIYMVNQRTGNAPFQLAFAVRVPNAAPVFGLLPNPAPAKTPVSEGESLNPNTLPPALLGLPDLTTILSDANREEIVPTYTITDPAGRSRTLGRASLRFDGVDDRVTTNLSLNGLSGFTLSGWIRPASLTGSRLGLFGQNDVVEFGFISGPQKQLQLFTGPGNITVNYGFPVSEWHHVAAVGSTTEIQIFLDGQLAGSSPVATGHFGRSDHFLNIGGGGIFDSSGNFFDGFIDEVSVWNRALSASELAVVKDGALDPTSPNLLAYYPINEFNSTTARDLVAGMDGLLGGGIASQSPAWSTNSDVPDRAYRFTDDGDYQVTITAIDAAGASDTLTATLHVNNVAPTARIRATGGETVGAPVLLSPTGIADPSPTDRANLAFRWEVSTPTGQSILASSDRQFSFIPEFAGPYEVTLTVTDPSGGASSAKQTILVNPVSALADSTGVEGQAIALSSTASSPKALGATRTFSWRIANAEGQNVVNLDDVTLETLRFLPRDNGIFTARLRITDTIAGQTFTSQFTSASINVANTAPAISILSPASTPEGEYSLVFQITDPAAADNFTVQVEWGDGQSEQVARQRDGRFTLTHTYNQQGLFPITLSVLDDDQVAAGSAAAPTATARLDLSVSNVAPTVNAGENQAIPDGQAVQFNGTSTDVGNDTQTAVWDFGDGSSAIGLAVSHTYSQSGVYIATLTVTDSDGGAGTSSLQVTVRNQPPRALRLDAGTPTSAPINTSQTFTGSFTDVSGDDVRGTVDFGDGSIQPLALTRTVQPDGTADYSFATSHVFAERGARTITFVATDEDGDAAAPLVAQLTITDAVPDPTANFDQAGQVITSTGGNFEFTITYEDADNVKVSTLDGNDIQILGPAGVEAPSATFIGVINPITGVIIASPANAPLIVARYRIARPQTSGLYRVILRTGQVADANNNASAAPLTLGRFTVAGAAPTAALGSTPDLTAITAAPYQFTIIYNDVTSVRRSSLDNEDVRVSGPGGFNRLATLVSTSPAAGDATSIVATYQVAAPAAQWTSAANGSYRVIAQGAQVINVAGNSNPSDQNLGEFKVNIAPPATDTAPPGAQLTSAPKLTRRGNRAYSFTVTYSDPSGLLLSSINNTDIKVTGPRGFTAAARKISAVASADGKSVVVTYRINAPTGGWTKTNNGQYRVILNPNEVRDIPGNAAATAKTLGRFSVAIA